MSKNETFTPIDIKSSIRVQYPTDRLRLVKGKLVHPDGTIPTKYLEKLKVNPETSMTLINTNYLQMLEDYYHNHRQFIDAA